MFWHKFFDRLARLIHTLISKQWLGFGVATWLLREKSITDQVWVLAFGIAVGANVFQKVRGLDNAATRSYQQQ